MPKKVNGREEGAVAFSRMAASFMVLETMLGVDAVNGFLERMERIVRIVCEHNPFNSFP